MKGIKNMFCRKDSERLERIENILKIQFCDHKFKRNTLNRMFMQNYEESVEVCLECGKVINQFISEKDMNKAKANKIREYADWLENLDE